MTHEQLVSAFETYLAESERYETNKNKLGRGNQGKAARKNQEIITTIQRGDERMRTHCVRVQYNRTHTSRAKIS